MSDANDGYDVKRCAKCAAWIPNTATMCSYCGTSSPDTPPERPRGSVLSLRHGFSATKVLIGANVAYFLFSLYVQHHLTPDGNVLQWATTGTDFGGGLYAAGAYRHIEVVREHEWWRVLAAAFLHVGGLHIAVNMWSLYNVGTLAERLFGAPKFIVVYVASAIGASLAGSIWYSGIRHVPDDQILGMAGASGAIFGIAGLLFAFLLRSGTDRGREVAWSIGRSMAVMLVFGLFATFISQTGHVGGLLVGLAFGCVVSADFGGRVDVAALKRWTVVAAAAAVLCVASLLAAAGHAFALMGGTR